VWIFLLASSLLGKSADFQGMTFLLLLFSLIAAIIFGAIATADAAEIDLSTLGYKELVELKERINLAMWQCEEWQEVTIPQGVYAVGTDIPAGHWTIRAAADQSGTVMWGDVLDATGYGIDFYDKNNSIYMYERVYSETAFSYDPGDRTQLDLDLKDNQFIIIGYCDMVFTPYSGRPPLGFK